MYEFDRFVTNAVRRGPGPGKYSVELKEEVFNPNGTAFGGYVMALSMRTALLHLEDTGQLARYPHPLSAQAQFIAPNKPGWIIEMTMETLRTGRNLAFLQLMARREGKVIWSVDFVFNDFTKAQMPANFEVMEAPQIPPLEETVVYESPFRARFNDFIERRLEKGKDPFRSTTRVPAYLGFADGRPMDLLAASFFADLFTDQRFFASNFRRANVVRFGPGNETVPRGKIGIRASGTITMSVHFFRPPPPDSRFFLMDTEIGVQQGVGDYEIQMFSADSKRDLIGIARQVQVVWAVRNEEDEKEGFFPKL
ncbi:thioesterase-like superfamily-domain-containing protein [Hyaloraphidium curvatum]|nr:thioesterase-like superfamily-domain-containing protein [Hyaloraphidium curvatum]